MWSDAAVECLPSLSQNRGEMVRTPGFLCRRERLVSWGCLVNIMASSKDSVFTHWRTKRMKKVHVTYYMSTKYCFYTNMCHSFNERTWGGKRKATSSSEPYENWCPSWKRALNVMFVQLHPFGKYRSLGWPKKYLTDTLREWSSKWGVAKAEEPLSWSWRPPYINFAMVRPTPSCLEELNLMQKSILK